VSYSVRDYATWPEAFPGGVRITTGDGRVLEADQPHQLGAPENPMSRQQVVAKFRRNAALALDEASLQELQDAVLDLEHATDLSAALSPLQRARGPVAIA
jgi:2-methylcitrate dehydratase PrpD